MNLAKYEAKKKELNVQLRKVFDATPIAEAWMAGAIASEMRRLGTGGGDLRSVLGCLSSLVEIGMVEEVERGLFRKIRRKEKPPLKLIEATPPATKPTTTEESAMQAKPAVVSVPSPVNRTNPIERLSSLAERLRDLANDMDGAALELAEQSEKNEQETAKMRQLQALLKSLG